MTELCVLTCSGCRQTSVRFIDQHLATFFKRNHLAVFTHGSNVLSDNVSTICVNKTKRIQVGLSCVCACVSDIEGLFDREDDVFDLRQAVVLQDFGVRHGDVDAGHPGDRRVQVVEGRTLKHTHTHRGS